MSFLRPFTQNLVFGAALTLGCSAAPLVENDEETADEGALSLFESDAKYYAGRVVISDERLANELSQSSKAKKVTANGRDTELSGGLTFLAGAEFKGVYYGVICKPATTDSTCVVRWLSKEPRPAVIRVGGELAARLQTVFPKSFAGQVAGVLCEDSSCLLVLDIASSELIGVTEVMAPPSDVKKFAGL